MVKLSQVGRSLRKEWKDRTKDAQCQPIIGAQPVPRCAHLLLRLDTNSFLLADLTLHKSFALFEFVRSCLPVLLPQAYSIYHITYYLAASFITS